MLGDLIESKVEEEIVEYFAKSFCVICRKRIIVMCGTPLIVIGGCCCGVDSKQVSYRREVRCHLDCYIKKGKQRVKTLWSFDDIVKLIEENGGIKEILENEVTAHSSQQ
jgi:hypothetical protein